MKLSWEFKILSGFALVFVFLGGIGFATYRNNQLVLETEQWVRHTQDVLFESELILKSTIDTAAAARGYYISGEDSFLQHMNGEAQFVYTHLSELKRLTSDNTSQQKRVAELENLLPQRLEISQDLVSLKRREDKGVDFASEKVLAGKKVMDRIRSVLDAFQQEERALLKERGAAYQAQIQRFNTVSLLVFAVALAVVTSLFLVVWYQLKLLQKTQGEAVASKEWFRTALKSIGDAVVATDANAIVTFANPAAERLMGWNLESMTGKALDLVFNIVNERTRQLVENPVKTVLRENRTVDLASHTILIRKDGQEIAIDDSATPIFNGGKDPVGAILIFRDVGLQRKSERLLTGFVEFAPDAIVVVNRLGMIVMVNKQTEVVFGYKRDELIGQILEILLPDKFKEEHVKHRDAFFAAAKAVFLGRGVALFGKRKDGSEIPVEISLSPFESDGEALVIASVRDITQKKADEEKITALNTELEHSLGEVKAINKEMEAFSYSVSHDLRAPLRSLDGFSQALLEDYGDRLDEQAKDYLGRIRKSAQSMAKLIDDLLGLSRITRAELRREAVNLSALANEIVADLRLNEPQREADISIQEGVLAIGDARLIQALLENLLRNAWKFTSKKPKTKITFSTEEQDGNTVYSVRDNGAGFDMAYADKLFGAFQRLHRTSDFPGTGIGLATAQRIVHRHGGRIWAEAAIDQGATFHFTLK